MKLPVSNFYSLVGENFSGKSTILQSIDILLQKTYSFDELDFHDTPRLMTVHYPYFELGWELGERELGEKVEKMQDLLDTWMDGDFPTKNNQLRAVIYEFAQTSKRTPDI